MLRVRCPVLVRCAPMLMPLLLLACSNDEAPPPESPEQVTEKKKEQAKQTAKTVAEAPKTLPTPPALPPPAAPPSLPLRDGAPIIVAQYNGGSLVPLASRRANVWTVEEVLTLDLMPEGVRGKDAHAEVLLEWWNKLDVQTGDTFVLRGDRGAEGTFKVKREFAAADRGGCVGLVWALPGEANWQVKPKAATGSSPAEHVWALRGPWAPRSGHLGRELTDAERKAGREALKQTRDVFRGTLPALAKGRWQECDSLSEPPCNARGAGLLALDLEGDGKAEALTTIQFRSPNGTGIASGGVSPVESRVLLSLAEKESFVLGRWGGDSSQQAEEAQAPAFAGLIDITGDGRSEIIMSRTINETQNWELFEASTDKPGTWTSLFKTQFEGC